MMNRLKIASAALMLALPLLSCASYNAYQKARGAEQDKDWDVAVTQYQKALEIDPDNTRFKLSFAHAKLEASRAHFEKGKSLRAAALQSTGAEQARLNQLAATELELTVKLDSTNQYAAIELAKTVQMLEDYQRATSQQTTIDDVKKRAKNITKVAPPTLNPASNDPISLSFPRETPVKDIYRALGNAFGINILFDQAVKDDRITIELRDVTAQAALERVMQAANHFYKALDEKTIIVVPDNPQARRDYEDLVIQTFYLSNGDAEQVTNVVRTMIEARNVFPLKALNAITIRDTADKVKIAEKIISANDKAKAEVVVEVELVQLDLSKVRDIGMSLSGYGTGGPGAITPTNGVDKDGKPVAFTGGTLSQIAEVLGSAERLRQNLTFSVPSATYLLLKTLGNSELLANPQMRISEGEKATLHIGQRIPVPVSTFQAVTSGSQPYTPVTSFQYQDVGIKVSMEPRVHHNREVTLKLTVEVSNLGPSVTFAGQEQPSFATRTIESTIRLKDGETNFLAGLIQSNKTESAEKTPFLGEIPVIGRLFSRDHKAEQRTDLVLTMTPHIVRIPDITDDDVAPMWVGTTNNITFRGVSPRIESQVGTDPFSARREQENAATVQGLRLSEDGEPGNYVMPQGVQPQPGGTMQITPPSGGAPNDPFRQNPPTQQPPVRPPEPEAKLDTTGGSNRLVATTAAATEELVSAEARLRLSPRIAPQPANVALKPGESRIWSVVGMDLDGLSATQLLLHFDPRSMDVSDIAFGEALAIDPKTPPVATINREAGTIKVVSSDGKPLTFLGGGNILLLRVQGGLSGETFLVMENPDFHNGAGQAVMAAVASGRVKVD
ncbi:MAG TPA: secretin N-terminal domain-containing protein [Thermoanaerobaculia bacterium]|nr:secretin N-terminal domain-containing protein [Thermoanaerobaculia bacterium]